jgi:hypothetical protein
VLWSLLIPRIRDRVAHDLPAGIGSFEHPRMGGMRVPIGSPEGINRWES